MLDTNSLSYLNSRLAKDIAVRETRAASAVTAGWLNRMLGPAIAACRFDAIPAAVEIRRIDWCAAYAQKSKRDSAICISSKAVFWTQVELCEIVLHEFAHMLVFRWEDKTGHDVDTHGPIFFLVLLALYRRVDRSKSLSHEMVLRASLYDFADLPASFRVLEEYQSRGMVIRWAMEHYDDLAMSTLPAEQLPALAWERWEKLLAQCRKWDADDVQAKIRVAGLQQENTRLRQNMARLVGAGWVCIAALMLLAWVMLVF